MVSVLNTKDEEWWALIHSVASFDYSQIIDILLERSISYGERAEHEGRVGVGADSLSGKLRLLSNHRHPA
ncbi:hypothetical protein ZEAMMB73_Zm00001d007605 [Zea mays]|uniref:Uncharacterized protein n=1 Tax=Zea mays TaxID=4577 RepID=A0A1D6F7I6_MAIZE|nr:hypothetical protein ZEAMMB73_Zm00001d007605 [Zea mays]ONM27202.1 hypothetical protein ZEAMMB73_Zm00001d007605 [Zea mays]ONM27205.1 hypothetical protein ZEAMMB73_Zm00001d007605 [Zea mays]ONM27206.1 hypothetical protein ZEAMMB73_Zm00001d007605 [Zea mays]